MNRAVRIIPILVVASLAGCQSHLRTSDRSFDTELA